MMSYTDFRNPKASVVDSDMHWGQQKDCDGTSRVMETTCDKQRGVNRRVNMGVNNKVNEPVNKKNYEPRGDAEVHRENGARFSFSVCLCMTHL